MTQRENEVTYSLSIYSFGNGDTVPSTQRGWVFARRGACLGLRRDTGEACGPPAHVDSVAPFLTS